MKATSKRMQKRLGKGWRSVLEEGKKAELHLSSEKAETQKKTEKEGLNGKKENLS